MVKSIHILLLAACPLASAQMAPVETRTIAHMLREHPAVLINAQGWAQHDLSIRGSSYAGAGISLNGLTLKSPYSAHFNTELPLPGFLLSAPAVQTGLNTVSGHPVGTAAYQTAPHTARRQAGVGIGTREHYQAAILGGTDSAGAFLVGEKARRIDHAANDLDRVMGGAHAQHVLNDWQFDLIGAHQRKTFGTQGYYGTAAYAEQTVEDSLLFLGATRGDPDAAFVRAGAALRQMDIDDTDSRHAALALEGRTLEIQHIALNLRGDVENEYANGRDRTRGSILILPEARFEHFKISAGVNSVFQTSESADALPLAGIDWLATDNTTLYASYAESTRQPDFQTLDSNPLLQQQRVQNTELGIRQFVSASLDWRAAAFHRRHKNASDWIGGTATDLGTLETTGVESEIRCYPSDDLMLRAFYQWIHKDTEVEGGLYETDYPEHMLNVSADWRWAPEFLLFAAQTLRFQTDHDARTGSDFGAEASVGLHYLPRFANNAHLSFRVDNLWGSDFQAIPGLKPPGRTVSTGITVAW